MATTDCPILILSESPNFTVANGLSLSILIIARSLIGSRANTFASNLLPSFVNTKYFAFSFSTTCRFVRIVPSSEMINPVPPLISCLCRGDLKPKNLSNSDKLLAISVFTTMLTTAGETFSTTLITVSS